MDVMELIREAADEAAANRVSELLESKGVGKEVATKLIEADDSALRFQHAERVFMNNGWLNRSDPDQYFDRDERESQRVTYRELVDAIGVTESTSFIPRVLTTVVREAVEPALVITNLFRPLRIPAATSVIKFPSVGAMVAFDLAEGQEYPRQKLEAAGYVIAKIGKSGLMVAMTDEVIRYSSFDLIGLHVRAAGRALARLKEVKAADQLETEGILSFDNSDPDSALNGSTTGRAFNRQGNDTMIIDDVFQMYADLVNSGFIPSHFIVNPIGWLIFAREPSMRAWAFQNGRALFQAVKGQPGQGQPDESPNLGPPKGSGTGNTAQFLSTTQANPPIGGDLFPGSIGMVVSPFVTFDTSANTTSIHLVDSEEVGVLVQDEDPMTEQFDDPHRDIQFIKFRERYGLAISNDGEGVVTARSVSTAKGFDWEKNAQIEVTGELPAI